MMKRTEYKCMPYAMRADTPFSRMPACLMDPASLKRHSKPPLHPTLAGWFSVAACELSLLREVHMSSKEPVLHHHVSREGWKYQWLIKSESVHSCYKQMANFSLGLRMAWLFAVRELPVLFGTKI